MFIQVNKIDSSTDPLADKPDYMYLTMEQRMTATGNPGTDFCFICGIYMEPGPARDRGECDECSFEPEVVDDGQDHGQQMDMN